MLRNLQVKKNKPIKILTASAELTRGAVVAIDHAGNVGAITSGVGTYLVDCPKDYTGLYSIYNPADRASDTITIGSKCSVIPTMLGERYATTQLTQNYADVGDPLTAASGGFVKSAGGATYEWVYGGAYSDPSVAMHVVEKVESSTAPAARTLTYNANGGTGTMTDARSPYFVGKVATALASTFVPPTYKAFVDYDTAANGSGTNYAEGASITIAGGNIVLYAQYANSYTLLVLDANTGTGTMTDTEKYYVDDVITVPDNTFTPPTDKVFSKWNTAANGTGTDYAPDAEITVITGMIGAATTLYAIWTDA